MSPFLLDNSLGFLFVQWDIRHWLLSGGGLRLTGKWGLRVQAVLQLLRRLRQEDGKLRPQGLPG